MSCEPRRCSEMSALLKRVVTRYNASSLKGAGDAMGTAVELPERLRNLFWDCDFDTVTWEKHRAFIIRRVLDRGDWDAIQWLRAAAGDQTIREWFLAKRGGGLDPRKLRFWELILDLPKEEADKWVAEARKTTWHGRRRR